MSLCLLAACSEADDIRDRIDWQNERLAALENLVEQVNGNVLAISALFDESILIADFREKTDSDGTVIGYVLELSDGQQIEVTFGDELDPLVPVIGAWMRKGVSSIRWTGARRSNRWRARKGDLHRTGSRRK